MTSFLQLYIDPGTGSMLFSILIGATATLYFLGRAAILKAKFLVSGKNAKADTSANAFVIYNEGKQYSNLFLPIVEEFEMRQLPVAYFTSAKDDVLLERDWKFVKTEFIGEGNAAFARLNMMSADVVLATTPGLDVYQWKRSKRVKHYAHILHAAADATMYRLFGIDYYDSVLLTGDYQKKDIRTLETQRGISKKDLVAVGCPYLDVLSKKIASLPEENGKPFTVLVSPSWGASALLSKFGEKLLDPLAESGWRIIVRPHPQSKKSEAQMLEKLQARYKGNSNVEWDFEHDNIISMKKSDVMISDFSGIIFDYTFLFGKPVFYANSEMDLRPYDAYDLDNQGKDLWQFRVLHEFGIELKESDFPKICDVIKNASTSEKLSAAREDAKNAAWMFEGKAGKKVVDFMIAKREEILAAEQKVAGVA